MLSLLSFASARVVRDFAPLSVFTGLEDGSGACMDSTDQSKWTSDGETNFSSDLKSCGTKCFGGADCTAKCIAGKGYAEPCATCFGTLTGCTKQHCMLDCMTNSASAKCKNCVDKYCTSDFETCSGLTPPSSLEDGSGACMDTTDQSKWNSDGQTDFAADLQKCGTQCFGGADCTAKCIEGK